MSESRSSNVSQAIGKLVLSTVRAFTVVSIMVLNYPLISIAQSVPQMQSIEEAICGDEASDSPITLHMPFHYGQTWYPGGDGSFYGDGKHVDGINDYYAVDWNKGSDSSHKESDAGELVLAVANGVVQVVPDLQDPYLGWYLTILHESGISTTYAHLQSRPNWDSGQQIYYGNVIGYVGNTGSGTGEHLHLSLKLNGDSKRGASPSPSPMLTQDGAKQVCDNVGMTSENYLLNKNVKPLTNPSWRSWPGWQGKWLYLVKASDDRVRHFSLNNRDYTFEPCVGVWFLIEPGQYELTYLYELRGQGMPTVELIPWPVANNLNKPACAAEIEEPPPSDVEPGQADSAIFMRDVTLPDNGPALAPGQVLPKTWRVRNSGTTTWEGYKLIFVSGNQMGATSPANIPRTLPGQEVNISISFRVPDTPSRGYWQIVNREGVWVSGGKLWVSVTVEGQPPLPPPGDAIAVSPAVYPSVVSPGQTFRPQVPIQVKSGQLLASRGDMLRNIDGNLYGSHPHVAVVGTVNAGQPYTFEFYENNPIVAPSGTGSYNSRWRVWRDGAYVGPEINIRFNVGSGTRPNPPALQSPSDWHVSRDGSTPTLCVNPSGGVEYFFQIYESHTTPDSGWISNNCWTPSPLGAFTYQWHVKARSGTLESDWSETRYFSIDSQELTMDDLVFSPGSSSAADEVRIYTCVRGFGGIGLGLELYANTATDGSANGDWQYIHTVGTFCYNRDDPNTWPTWPTLPLADGTHLIRATGFHDGQTIVKEATYTLQHRRSNGTALLSPIDDLWLNERTVTFRWGPSTNAQGYRLYVGTTDNRNNANLFTGNFDANTFSHTLTLSQDYPNVYWWLGSFNDVGENCCSRAHFGIDRVAPTSAVTALPSAVTDTKFTVPWSGHDDRSQVRWYDIQYRDGSEGEWLDWQINVTKFAEIFGGQPGHTYCFRSHAMDVAGNWEAYPEGNGDTCTTIDLSAGGGDWWHPDYAFKRNLVVLNNDGAALPAGYPIHLRFDSNTSPTSAELYVASQSAVKGDDVRIVINNQAQLDRFVQIFSPERIDIWFNLQSGIASSPGDDSTSYQLYYGNSSANNPPGSVNSVLSPGLDANTVGLWHLQEVSGDTLLDSSGRGHNGTINNGSRDLSGKLGGAVVFNGSSTLLNMGDHADFDLRSFTIEGWYYFTSPGIQSLLWRDKASGQIEAYNFATRDGKIEAGIDGRNDLRSQTQFQPNRWYHLAVTYDGTTERVFVNGREEASVNDSGGTPASAGPIIIGRNRANSDWFSGKMQHVRVSNIARTSFPYGSYADILLEPTAAAGDATPRPQPGTPDLVVEEVSVFNTAEGTLVQATVTNHGDGATGNGFWIDLYQNHEPTGPGDTNESIRYWVASPIEAGATLTLTTLVTQTPVVAATQVAALQETSSTLYVQADSRGTVLDPNKSDNISAPVELCLAAADNFEGNNSSATATLLTLDAPKQTHNLHVVGDQDWFKFTATAGQSYIFETSDLGASADTYLYLYSPDGIALLGSNDDNGESLASRLQWEAPSNGTYYLLVKHWNPNVGGCGSSYSIAVTSAPAVTAGDCNGDQAVNVADAISVAREFYDGDNNNDPASAPNGGFPGTPACDANEDGAINVADAICISRIFYDGPGACIATTSTETPHKFDETHNIVESDIVPFTPLAHESEIYLPYMSSNR